MSNSDPILTQPPSARPHRRLSLTQPTTTAPLAAGSELIPAPSPTLPEASSEAVPTVRVMAYLSPEEARVLDETWLKLRSHPSRPSKSDILRAACALASQDFETLARILSEQQISTLSRQRSSKNRKHTS